MTDLAPHPLALLPEELASLPALSGEPAFRSRQIFRWMHGKGTFEPDRMTDLSRPLRERLREVSLGLPLVVSDVVRSRDGTRKLVCDLARGGRIECVLIPMNDEPRGSADPADEPDEDDGEDAEAGWDGRVTLCVSTQIGCAMGCVFCASGQAGLERGLGPEEIVAQILVAKRYLDPGEHLRNLVFMGMGEPLHHYDSTARALRILMHPEGSAISPRRITVSTVGLVPGIRKLGEDFGGKVGLALSLHAPNDQIRGRIMPMNRKYPFAEVLAALRAYPLPKRRRITIEYTLIQGLNDEVSHARELARALRGVRVKVNLIPMNGISASNLEAPGAGRVQAFREALVAEGLSAFVRKTRGDDASAACGQLVLRDRLLAKSRSDTCSDASS